MTTQTKLTIDREFDHYSMPGLLVRCGWHKGPDGRFHFVECVNGRYRLLPKDEYRSMISQAALRCDNPYADDLTKHYAAILADWSI